MHMLEAGVPIMAIKNFLGHASVTTTEHYAELTQNTVDQKIREWDRRWFHGLSVPYRDNVELIKKYSAIPNFLK